MTVRIINADVMEGLKKLPDESVHCVVTSPPYWGLRDYGTGTWKGGDPDCDHKGAPKASTSSTLKNDGRAVELVGRNNYEIGAHQPFRDVCGKCGAKRIDQQIGLEQTPEEFIQRLVEVFREVKRVLRKDGTLWVNMGDSYNNSDKWGGGGTNTGKQTVSADGDVPSWAVRKRRAPIENLKPKDLIGVPWLLAFALRADGWYLRSDVIWAKPNPMPESVTDRPTKAHEYIFLLTKADRYFYDHEAIKEPATYDGSNAPGSITSPYGQGFTRRNTEERATKNEALGKRRYAGFNARWDAKEEAEGPHLSRNKRSVWTISTKPFAEAHFATFPPELPEMCIKAGTSQKGCCAKCGAPLERKTGRDVPMPDVAKSTLDRYGDGDAGIHRKIGSAYQKALNDNPVKTLGWSPSCSCNAPVIPCTVLDPFGGAGTTGLVADRLQRNAILIELNPEYAALAKRRIDADRGGGLLDLMEAAE